MEAKRKIMEAKCRFCGKGMYAMTEKHILYLSQAHEMRCPYNPTKKTKIEDVESSNTDSSLPTLSDRENK